MGTHCQCNLMYNRMEASRSSQTKPVSSYVVGCWPHEVVNLATVAVHLYLADSLSLPSPYLSWSLFFYVTSYGYASSTNTLTAILRSVLFPLGSFAENAFYISCFTSAPRKTLLSKCAAYNGSFPSTDKGYDRLLDILKQFSKNPLQLVEWQWREK